MHAEAASRGPQLPRPLGRDAPGSDANASSIPTRRATGSSPNCCRPTRIRLGGSYLRRKNLSRKAARLWTLVEPIGEAEPVLQQMWEVVKQVVDEARFVSRPGAVSRAVLFEVHRCEVDTKLRRLFDSRLEEDI
ncbi:hypothetical protein GQ53DRAFT_764705 [Thozetella sp. PMI_491]|nr:hypothetical protein GQ53DRAFT_764705 [Thozetella sp. PMI_491]